MKNKNTLNSKKKYMYAYIPKYELNKNRKWWEFKKPKYIETKTRVRLEICD